jgi:hypothetical protein
MEVENEERLADIMLLLRNDEVVGTGLLGPVIIPSHMPDSSSSAAAGSDPSSPQAAGPSSSSSSSSGIGGGNESCAHALSVLMMVLAHYPKYQDLIYDEVSALLRLVGGLVSGWLS